MNISAESLAQVRHALRLARIEFRYSSELTETVEAANAACLRALAQLREVENGQHLDRRQQRQEQRRLSAVG